MAQNRIYAGDERKNRARVVPAGTRSGDHLIVEGRPAVAITDRGDATKSFELGGITLSGLLSGGSGLEDNEASLAFDGTWEFAVPGSTLTTAQGASVYRTTAGALTLTEGTNVLFGVVDYPIGYHKAAGRLPVRIGD